MAAGRHAAGEVSESALSFRIRIDENVSMGSVKFHGTPQDVALVAKETVNKHARPDPERCNEHNEAFRVVGPIRRGALNLSDRFTTR